MVLIVDGVSHSRFVQLGPFNISDGTVWQSCGCRVSMTIPLHLVEAALGIGLDLRLPGLPAQPTRRLTTERPNWVSGRMPLTKPQTGFIVSGNPIRR